MDKIIKENKNKDNNGHNIKYILLLILCFVLGVGLMYFYEKMNPTVITNNKTISETKVSEVAMEDAISKIYDAVLCIEVLDNNGNKISSGTGFVYRKDNKYGYVLTNSHVVSGANNIQGLLSNNKVVDLKLLGMDVYTDLAVLRMDAKEIIKIASIGKSENTKLGNTVFTVGSPLGASYSGTVTKGILSGKDRLIETRTGNDPYNTESFIVKVLQTDAAISPGNSGGPLVNLAGDVIGINSLKLVDEKVEGMGFAIPIEDAMRYVDVLEKGEKIKRPLMGVQVLDLTNKYLLYRYGINIDPKINSGIILMKVNIGSPAANAGLKENDIITEINGNKINTIANFKYELYKYSVGDTVEVTYFRNGKQNKTKLTLNKSSE